MNSARLSSRLRASLVVGAVLALSAGLLAPVPSASATLSGEKVELDGQFFDIAVDHALGQIYLANPQADTLTVLDVSTKAVIANVPIFDGPFSIAVNTTNHRVYVLSQRESRTAILTVVDGATRTVVGSPRGTGRNVAGIVVDQSNGTVYLTGSAGPYGEAGFVDAFQESDLATPVASVVLPSRGLGIAIDDLTRRLWVTNSETDSVSVIDRQSMTIVASVPVGNVPQAVAIDPLSRRAFVVNRTGVGNHSETDPSDVSVIDLDSFAVVRTVEVGLNSNDIVVNSATGTVYVPSGKANFDGESFSTLSLFGVGSTTVSRTERVVAFANDIALDSATGTIYVASSGQPGAISVIPGQSVTAPSRTPIVKGIPRVGNSLTAESTGWPTGTTLAYTWNLDGVARDDSSTVNYLVRPIDSGKRITVTVTGSRPGLRPYAVTSPQTAVVAAGTFPIRPVPVITGPRRVGSVLTAVTGTWVEGTTFSYRWYRNGKAIKAATQLTYVPVAADIGKRLIVRVGAVAPGYAPAVVTSPSTGRVLAGTISPGVISLIGAPAVGELLEVRADDRTAGTRVSYQWYAGNKIIKGATASTLRLNATHLGKVIRARLAFTRSGYTATSVTFTVPTRIAPGTLVTPVPVITGSGLPGSTLGVIPNGLTPGSTVNYVWTIDGVPVSGAVGSRYVVRDGDAGHTIAVTLNVAKAGYTPASVSAVGVLIPA